MRLRLALAASLAAALLAACGDRAGEGRRTLSERERDSTLGASPLPGAGTVGRALERSDSAAARARRLDATLQPSDLEPGRAGD